AVGVGIDLAEGSTSSATCKGRSLTYHPDTGCRLDGFSVPDWDEVLKISARSYDMSGLGYMGVDLVLDEHRGPLLLELNARPGLAVQLANREGLLQRIKEVSATPSLRGLAAEERVAWAQDHFIMTFCRQRVSYPGPPRPFSADSQRGANDQPEGAYA
ncbi:MAG: sugar-transfer associated ATP-grasp domain-containing protein, partial [Dehalococcoidia bacterium]